MSKTVNFPKRASILKLLHGSSARERMLHRLHCVALAAAGMSPAKIAELYCDSPRAVAYWVKRFESGGAQGLEDEPRPGRPPRIDARQQKRLQSFVTRCNAQGRAVNATVVSQFLLTEFNVSIAPRQCWRILNKLKRE